MYVVFAIHHISYVPEFSMNLLPAAIESMYGLPDLVVVERISNLPIVKSTLGKATDLYDKVKQSNRLIGWSVKTAEGTVVIAISLTKPAIELYKPVIVLFDGPIHLVDEILCKSLDMVEEAVPIIKQEPAEIYLGAKNFVTSVMEPVLKRADSVKEISIQNAAKYGTIAAESLDNALTVADGIVDKYLPEIESADRPDGPTAVSPMPQTQTEKAIRHVNKFSHKLKRRLTQRTIYEARELKKQGVNLIHILVQLTDLLARDPKAFAQKMKDLWMYLSDDEPENQAPPQNLEQLIVMLTREGARRMVHIANFTANTTVNIPKYAKEYITYALHKYSEYVQTLNLNSTGIKRQYQILKNIINDVFDRFLSLIKPVVTSLGQVTQSIHNVPHHHLHNHSRFDKYRLVEKKVSHLASRILESIDQVNGALTAAE